MFRSKPALAHACVVTIQVSGGANVALEVKDSYEYLGVILHYKLSNHKAMSAKIKAKVRKAAGNVARIINERTPPVVVRMLINLCVRSVYAYALAYWKPSDGTLQQFDNAPCIPIRKCMRMPRDTHIATMLGEFGIPVATAVREYKIMCSTIRLANIAITSPLHPAVQCF